MADDKTGLTEADIDEEVSRVRAFPDSGVPFVERPGMLEIIHSGFSGYPYEVAIDGWLLRTPRQKHPRRFMTLGAAHRALRKEVRLRGLEWSVPYERRGIEIGARL